MKKIIIVGGGLAGSEAAWQAAQMGIQVDLYEMRPGKQTGAHVTSSFAELVCSNSLGSFLEDRASGLLKAELRRMGSLLLTCAEETAVPAGGALAVDRVAFADMVTKKLEDHENISIYREEVRSIPDCPSIIATGPLTSRRMSESIRSLTGTDHLFFFDAIAPSVSAESIDMGIAFKASRYGRGAASEGDYINCPMNEEEYNAFLNALVDAETIRLREFESTIQSGVNAGVQKYFEGCLPVEIIAKRGKKALSYGPMRPVGLINPRTGKRAYAIVQLRQDDLAGRVYNLVGFQTNLKFSEQSRVFRMIPGMENAEFVRYGQMHRNTFIFSPHFLRQTMQFKGRDDLFFAGQITGVEGYVGNIGTGLIAGKNAARLLNGVILLELPKETMLGALCHYITHASERDFQPMKANYGIVPALNQQVKGKRQRAQAYSRRALGELDKYLSEINAHSH